MYPVWRTSLSAYDPDILSAYHKWSDCPLDMIRKGQARWVSEDDVRQQNRFIDRLFDLAA